MPDNNETTTTNASPNVYEKLINLNGLSTYHEEILKLFQKYKQEANTPELHFANDYLEFPAVGEDAHLYVDLGSNKIYVYSEELLRYVVVGSDYNEIQVINGDFS